jgi:hypothetical protein
MALELRGIPVLEGEAAERFVRLAEEAEKNSRTKPLRISHEAIDRMEERGKEFLKKHGKTIQFR